MHVITQYERRYINHGQVINGCTLNVLTTILVLIKRQYSWLNSKWACTRITELSVPRKTEVNSMSSLELEGWGSCKPRQFTAHVGLREYLLSEKFITRPYDSEPYLPLNAWAIKSHIDDLDRVSRGLEPTQCTGMGEDDDIYGY